MPTDIGGGGPNPPHGEDFFNRIVNVHWPKKAGAPTGGVFIAGSGSDSGNIYYLKVGPGGTLDDQGHPVWVSLGTLDFNQYVGDNFSGYVMGSAHAMIGGKEPVFVLVGGGGTSNSHGRVMASQDGLNWSTVFHLGDMGGGTFTGAEVFGVVWSEAEQRFYAGGHYSNTYVDALPGNTITRHVETDMLLVSSNGFDWSESGSIALTETLETLGDVLIPYPEYNTGLLASYCPDLVIDANGNHVPGGNYGYNEAIKLLITPTSLPAINYLFAYINYDPGGVAVQHLGAGTSGASGDVGIPTNCIAQAGDIWMAAGGIKSVGGVGGMPMTSISVPSTGAGGFGWKPIDISGDAMIITICGGQALALPP